PVVLSLTYTLPTTGDVVVGEAPATAGAIASPRPARAAEQIARRLARNVGTGETDHDLVVLLYEVDEGLLVTSPQAFQQSGLVNVLSANARESMPLHHCVRGTNPSENYELPVTIIPTGGL
ncbi:MAG TPA: hypothetical protein VG074_10320, partial [Acidimicrobiales bacterium]|nr:hypothetical protein [Acidimicrobiales bacterium]